MFRLFYEWFDTLNVLNEAEYEWVGTLTAGAVVIKILAARIPRKVDVYSVQLCSFHESSNCMLGWRFFQVFCKDVDLVEKIKEAMPTQFPLIYPAHPYPLPKSYAPICHYAWLFTQDETILYQINEGVYFIKQQLVINEGLILYQFVWDERRLYTEECSPIFYKHAVSEAQCLNECLKQIKEDLPQYFSQIYQIIIFSM